MYRLINHGAAHKGEHEGHCPEFLYIPHIHGRAPFCSTVPGFREPAHVNFHFLILLKSFLCIKRTGANAPACLQQCPQERGKARVDNLQYHCGNRRGTSNAYGIKHERAPVRLVHDLIFRGQSLHTICDLLHIPVSFPICLYLSQSVSSTASIYPAMPATDSRPNEKMRMMLRIIKYFMDISSFPNHHRSPVCRQQAR